MTNTTWKQTVLQEINKLNKVFVTHDQFTEVIHKVVNSNGSPISSLRYEIKRNPPYSNYILGTEQKEASFFTEMKWKDNIYNVYTECKINYWPKIRIPNKNKLERLLKHLFKSFWKPSLRNRVAGIPDIKNITKARNIAQNTINDKRNWPYYLLYCDLDDFRRINNECGHDIGDDIIKKVGSTLELESKNRAILLHNGGDEFILVLVKEKDNTAYNFAHKLRQVIRNADYNDELSKCENYENETFDDKITITLSIGLCTSQERNIKLDELLCKADTALLKYAKKNKSQIKLLH